MTVVLDAASSLFQCLRLMDAEAGVRPDGKPTGLNWYGGHQKRSQKRPQTEPCWTQRLAELLPGYGFPAKAEVRYPRPPKQQRNRCDLVIDMPQDEKLWLEIKGAWKAYWTRPRGRSIYRSYLLSPLVPGLGEKTHTVPGDLAKLKAVRWPEGTEVGLLLVGFEAVNDPMDGDIAELVMATRLDRPPWQVRADAWPDRYRAGERVRCWLWRRPAE